MFHPLRFSKAALLAIPLTLGSALAEEADGEEPVVAPAYRRAILFSPVSPVLSIVAYNEIRKETDGENILGIGALDLNVRGIHIPESGTAVSAQIDLTTVNLFFRSTHLGARAGPRFDLRGRGLSDWTATPFLLAGVTLNSAGSNPLSRWGVLGIGGQLGRTWVWRRLVNELEIGAYSATSIAYSTQAESLEDVPAPEFPSLMPLFSWSVGYAF